MDYLADGWSVIVLDPTAQCVGEKLFCRRGNKLFRFGDKVFAQVRRTVQRKPVWCHARSIDEIAAVLIPPPTRCVKILEGKSEWIHDPVA